MPDPDAKRPVTPEEYKLRLQVETTLLVWVRTSLALMGFGFVIARFGLFLREVARVGSVKVSAHPRLALANSVTGTGMILLGVVVLLAAIYGHRRTVTRLERGDLNLPSRWSAAVILGLVLAALGMVMAAYLAVIES
jgi:putative membrane protein